MLREKRKVRIGETNNKFYLAAQYFENGEALGFARREIANRLATAPGTRLSKLLTGATGTDPEVRNRSGGCSPHRFQFDTEAIMTGIQMRKPENGGLPRGVAFLLIGVGIGSLMATMLTPKTGRQMRREVRRRYEDARDTVGEWSEQANTWLRRGSDWAQSASDKVAPFTRRFSRFK